MTVDGGSSPSSLPFCNTMTPVTLLPEEQQDLKRALLTILYSNVRSLHQAYGELCKTCSILQWFVWQRLIYFKILLILSVQLGMWWWYAMIDLNMVVAWLLWYRKTFYVMKLIQLLFLYLRYLRLSWLITVNFWLFVVIISHQQIS